ncbi:EAL domain-containing protein [Solirubrobacter sp. CPCC 204708]|uniref:EAL domain-containing protein n=1 Tax=Solirubrobacter deserti TaxID=2282478 RepID=A0ABT4RGA7_9ACTN|nr:GGDEF and EAL domain-containing protein [Solirubrobacter deserti]MBE2319720.1 EAL domain-containing protein [Solirubrobacter deserti]MDA0137540.1 EAL domain-containing protein [Solirubrobacter deserti]
MPRSAVDDPSLEELYEDAPCGYLSMTADGTITRANRTFARSLGMGAEALVGLRLQSLMTAGSRLYAETHWRPRLDLAGELREMPIDLVRPDGSRLPVLLSAVQVGDSVRASLFDASDRRRYERELVAARDVERAARERVERLQELSAALSAAVGVDAVAQALVDTVFDAVAPEHCAVVLEGATVHERKELVGAAGPTVERVLALEVSGQRIGSLALTLLGDRALSPEERVFLDACAAAGATALRRADLYAQMQHQAVRDPLTGLPNWTLLLERLEHLIARSRRNGEPFAVVAVGLDNFKLVNDTRGHAVGNEVLKLIAARLSGAIRETDLVARAGGDEFIVVYADLAAEEESDVVAARLQATFDAPLVTSDGEIFVRASIGVVAAGTQVQDAERVLGDADVALMAAKRSAAGRHIRFDSTMRERARERARVEQELRTALVKDELVVHYQPIVYADDGALKSMEALVRWEHPVRGRVSPGVFVPVAEDCGLIVDIGRHVLRTACRQLAAWRAAGVVGEDVGVTVNVSARQLEQSGLAADVAAALAESGLDATPAVLGLELTESMLMNSPNSALDRLHELRALGVRLLLDDFGTGASSLARLRRLPVDTLKIDRAFITGLGRADSDDDAFVAAITSLAAALRLETVAEGVETDQQLARLRELGATSIQGFLFSQALPADEFARDWGAARR